MNNQLLGEIYHTLIIYEQHHIQISSHHLADYVHVTTPHLINYSVFSFEPSSIKKNTNKNLQYSHKSPHVSIAKSRGGVPSSPPWNQKQHCCLVWRSLRITFGGKNASQQMQLCVSCNHFFSFPNPSLLFLSLLFTCGRDPFFPSSEVVTSGKPFLPSLFIFLTSRLLG